MGKGAVLPLHHPNTLSIFKNNQRAAVPSPELWMRYRGGLCPDLPPVGGPLAEILVGLGPTAPSRHQSTATSCFVRRRRDVHLCVCVVGCVPSNLWHTWCCMCHPTASPQTQQTWPKVLVATDSTSKASCLWDWRALCLTTRCEMSGVTQLVHEWCRLVVSLWTVGSGVGRVGLSQMAAVRCNCTTTSQFITQAAFTSHFLRQ